MKLLTQVDIPRFPWSVRPTDRVALLGSCFSDHIAAQLRDRLFRVTANPTGTLYNPVSIAHHQDLFDNAEVVMITFGTAWVYRDLLMPPSSDPWANIVDNCRRRPASEFERLRLTVEDIVALWQPILQAHPDQRFVFTVSPIRHLKDGLHENQLSKAILLQAIERLIALQPKKDDPRVTYFPAYEIMLDELRDYRFYAADMMHPTETAVQYIFDRLVQTCFYDEQTQAFMQETYALTRAFAHRPLQPDSEDYKQFTIRRDQQLHQLTQRYPWLNPETVGAIQKN